MVWKYEPDEDPKKKHKWSKPVPGFVKVNGVTIGKCPSKMTNEEAEELLNQGIPWDPPRAPIASWPQTIYIVHDGCVYRAKPTNPGISYHAFPELPEKLRELPRTLRHKIEQKAEELGCGDKVRRWINR